MKNKKLNRLLLPAVLLIWLAVIFRWDGAGEAKASFMQAKSELLFQQDSSLFIPALTLDYRDPFLDKSFSFDQKTTEKGLFPQLIPQTAGEKEKSPDSFLYKGSIQVDGKTWGLLAFNSALKYIAPGEKMADWTVESIEWDRLLLSKKKQTVYLQISKDTLM